MTKKPCRIIIPLAMTLAAALSLGGCASKGEVQQIVSTEMETIRSDIDELRGNFQKSQTEMNEFREHQTRIEEKLALVDEAMNRAGEAQKLAKGKLLYEVTISDESVPFGFNQSRLSDEAKKQIDIFASVLVEENGGVFIEIQGHTDNVGSRQYNLMLGQERAEAVLAYLHTEHGIPLHRMSTFSYGETRPAGPNDNESNRARNRRVVLIVME